MGMRMETGTHYHERACSVFEFLIIILSHLVLSFSYLVAAALAIYYKLQTIYHAIL
jgi:hypothetical protein